MAVRESEAQRIASEFDSGEIGGPNITAEIRTRDLNECDEIRENSLVSLPDDPPTPAQWPQEIKEDTGDKGPNTHWVHGENIEIAVNM